MAGLNILFLASDTFPPFRVDVSVLFGREIVGRGHRVDWLLQDSHSCTTAYFTEWLGSKVLVGPQDNGTSLISRIRKHVYDLIHDCQLFRLLSFGKYDVVLVRDKFIAPLMAIVASKIYNVKFVYWLSYPYPEDFLYQAENKIKGNPLLYSIRGHLLKYLLYYIIIPFSCHTFVQSEKMLENIEVYGISRKMMTPVPMGVPIEQIPFIGYGARLSTKETSKTVLYLGTLSRVRRLDFLLRVFKKVLTHDRNVKLLLVGGGDVPADEQFLMDEAKKMGIEGSVTVTGFLPQQEAWKYVKDADVCVSPIYPTPTLECGSPTKLLEYMAMGKASVANDHPEQALVLAESGAGICVPWDEDAFASAVVSILGDQELRAGMGIRGRDYVEKHRNYNGISRFVEEKLVDIVKG
jgi:glycosyltransferase involved in cell wall biosynthesis